MSSCLIPKRKMHSSSTVYKQKQSKIFLNKYVGGQQGVDIFHWRKCYYGLIFLDKSDGLKLKRLNEWFVSYNAAFTRR